MLFGDFVDAREPVEHPAPPVRRQHPPRRPRQVDNDGRDEERRARGTEVLGDPGCRGERIGTGVHVVEDEWQEAAHEAQVVALEPRVPFVGRAEP